MSGVQLGDMSGVMQRRAHERVAEAQRLPIEVHETRREGGVQVEDGHRCARDDLGRPEDLGELSLVLERRDEQQGAGGAGQALGLRREGALEPCRYRQVVRERHAASTGPRLQGGRQLEDRERIAARLVEQSGAHARGQVLVAYPQELSRVGRGQRMELHLGQVRVEERGQPP